MPIFVLFVSAAVLFAGDFSMWVSLIKENATLEQVLNENRYHESVNAEVFKGISEKSQSNCQPQQQT